MSTTKISENTTSILNCYFTLWHIKLSKYRKINSLLINSIYLIISSLEVQKKTHTDQSIPQVFLLCLKRNDSQPFKTIPTTKNLFSSGYVIGTTCFDKMFLFLWQLEDNNFYKSSSLPQATFQLPCSSAV